jgi:hypothetical protein
MTVAMDNATSENARLVIYDYDGKEYYSSNHIIIGGNFDVDLSRLSMKPGIYFIRVETKDSMHIVKVIKN